MRSTSSPLAVSISTGMRLSRARMRRKASMPFISRLKALAETPDGKAIDLFHTTAVHDAEAIDLLERDAQAANVRLHVLWDERDGRLDAERICQTVSDWRAADVWFCGPAGFGQALKRDLTAMGLPEARFHQELFEMR